jgi:hypothetical protein
MINMKKLFMVIISTFYIYSPLTFSQSCPDPSPYGGTWWVGTSVCYGPSESEMTIHHCGEDLKWHNTSEGCICESSPGSVGNGNVACYPYKNAENSNFQENKPKQLMALLLNDEAANSNEK